MNMAWQMIEGLTGKVYLPEMRADAKKRACPDCYACQSCSDERCAVCRPGFKSKSGAGTSAPRCLDEEVDV